MGFSHRFLLLVMEWDYHEGHEDGRKRFALNSFVLFVAFVVKESLTRWPAFVLPMSRSVVGNQMDGGCFQVGGHLIANLEL